MEKVKVLETVDFEMEVQALCDPDDCAHDCLVKTNDCDTSWSPWN
ncbi:hypothetical protein ACYCSE_05445 [Paenibacillus sp. SEL1]|nr:hypothetical protein [Paenibacillus polymyxa]MDQ0049966.1 hypothetical protein [Paenibacillus polymyxa]